MQRRTYITGALICLWALISSLFAQEVQSPLTNGLSVAYVGNMGVLLSTGGATVLIDGLHKEYKNDYAYPSDLTVDEIINGTFQGLPPVSLSLVTHHHRDHFDAGLAKMFLLNNPGAKVIGPAQAINEIQADVGPRAIDTSVPLDRIRQGEVSVNAFNAMHVNRSRHHAVQNIGYLVELSEYKILHIGDAHWDVSASKFEQLELAKSSIDVAIIPFWMLLEKRSIQQVAKYINPRILIAAHIPPEFSADMEESLLSNFPGVIMFDKLNQRHELK